VITNVSDQSYELRREGASTAIMVDPGGSTTVRIYEGENIDLGPLVLQVY
jgi:hypothetical protein